MKHSKGKGWRTIAAAIVLGLTAVLFTACNDTPADQSAGTEISDTDNEGAGNGANAGNEGGTDNGTNGGSNAAVNNGGSGTDGNAASPGNGAAGDGTAQGGSEDGDGGNTTGSGSDSKAAMADPESVAVLVNKEFALPDDYEPDDLVYPDVRFTFKDKIEKRMMRSEAASALEELFAGAEEDGIYLAGVSAYRSHSTQTSLFNRYVEKDGLEKAKTYSAVPGHSEHETGLAIDVSASDGKCAAEDCFGETKEAAWLAEHATDYGFIIRYPEGQEDITGYKYEPWHLRYVGKEIAGEIASRGITLEEYYDAVPVSANP
ncbi:D-alanyl-D-alanine carboxypeptidase family protein [Paenibacillus sp. M1]|uniref:D-alanyl-D-alanine carboxypeptidase family protein n=1 Tax=Paenibacillus haidiansis TaxID=1574488 RepID=A0ABU7VWU0_9BACL